MERKLEQLGARHVSTLNSQVPVTCQNIARKSLCHCFIDYIEAKPCMMIGLLDLHAFEDQDGNFGLA